MRLLIVMMLALTGCETTVVTTAPDACHPVLDALEPSMGSADGGDTVRLSGLHVGSELGERDVAIHVGGARADVTAVFRDGCNPCDACTLEAFSCAMCERVCRGIASYEDADGNVWGPNECIEWVEFTTPANDEGEAELVLQNTRGSAGGIFFEYTAASDDDDSAQ